MRMGLVFATTKVRTMEEELLYKEFQTLLGQDKAAVIAALKERGLIKEDKGDISELEISLNLAAMDRAVYILELCPSPAREFLLDYYLPWRLDFYSLSTCMSYSGNRKSATQSYTKFEGCREAKTPAEFFELNLNTRIGEVFYELSRQKLTKTELKDLAYALIGKRLIARLEEERDKNILEAWGLISKEMDLADIEFIARCKATGKEVQEPLLLRAGGLIPKEDMLWLAKSPDPETLVKRLKIVKELDPKKLGEYLREMHANAMAGEGIGVILGFANLSLTDAPLARALLLGKSYGMDPSAIEEVYME